MNQSEVVVNVDYLKKYLEEQNLNNKEFAEKIGVHESTVSRFLRGKNGVGSKFIKGIVCLDDIDLKKLFIASGSAVEERII